MREILWACSRSLDKGIPISLRDRRPIHRKCIVERSEDEIDLIDGDQFLVVKCSLLGPGRIIIKGHLDLVAKQTAVAIDIVCPDLVPLLYGLTIGGRITRERHGNADFHRPRLSSSSSAATGL